MLVHKRTSIYNLQRLSTTHSKFRRIFNLICDIKHLKVGTFEGYLNPINLAKLICLCTKLIYVSTIYIVAKLCMMRPKKSRFVMVTHNVRELVICFTIAINANRILANEILRIYIFMNV